MRPCPRCSLPTTEQEGLCSRCQDNEAMFWRGLLTATGLIVAVFATALAVSLFFRMILA